MPEFMKEAGQLVKLMRKLSSSELSELLEINSQLTQLNTDRFFNWHTPFTPDNSKQTALLFDGEVFRGLGMADLTVDEQKYAQSHLRILSGLYGLLRPMDIIQPYRLEVSSALENPKGKDLYAFWRKKVTDSVVKALECSGEPHLILNLASSEYMKTLDLKKRKVKVIDVEFYEFKNDTLKQIVIYTKKARGLMARWIIQDRIEDENDLRGFGEEGYWFSPQMSTETKFVFVR